MERKLSIENLILISVVQKFDKSLLVWKFLIVQKIILYAVKFVMKLIYN